ncbi:unnamed protein product [Linum trigynum]|uniref:Uncharacterized protein n=1 Tax=Linum trigynum TaxID=586398 RepID=A0AAV2GRX1_9ROSI
MVLTKSMSADEKIVLAKQAADAAVGLVDSANDTVAGAHPPPKAMQGRPPVEDETEKEESQANLRQLVATIAEERRERLEESRRVWRRLDELQEMLVALYGVRQQPPKGSAGGDGSSGAAAVVLSPATEEMETVPTIGGEGDRAAE